MTKKVIFTLIVLGILLFGVIVLHVLSILSSFTLFGLEEEQYKALVSDAILVLAFGFALVPLFQASQNTRKLGRELKDIKEQFQKEHGIQSFPIQQKGEDDLEWMLPHYQQAGCVTIFAGSFDWLGDNEQIKQRIRQLATEDHLELVSYKTEGEVEEAFRAKNQVEMFQTLKGNFKFESKLKDVTCTFIQKSAVDWEFLYKSRADDKRNDFNVCVLSDTDRSRELLHVLSELTKAEHWGISAGDSSSAEQG